MQRADATSMGGDHLNQPRAHSPRPGLWPRACALLGGVLLLFASGTIAAAPQLTISVTGTQSPRVVRPGEANVPLYQLEFSSLYPIPIKLRSVTFSNRTTGPGGTAERDLEIGTLRLRKDDGDGVFEPAQDTQVAVATAAGGEIRFTGLDVTIPAIGSVRLFLGCDVSRIARDGDALDVAIDAANKLTFEPNALVDGTFPIAPPGDFAVDGMSATQLTLHTLPAAIVPAGEERRLVLDVTLPANGYSPDVLERIETVNLGTAQAGTDVTALQAWVDDGDGTFNPGADRQLGSLVSSGGGRWLITGQAEPVPLAGLRLFVTADFALMATDGRTVRLSLPTLPTVGVGMLSGNDGPNDQAVAQPNAFTISTANRINLASSPVPPQVARPGTTSALLHHVTAQNAYATSRTVTGLRFANASRGPGGVNDLDRSIQRVALRLDGNGDGVLGTLAEDPEVGATQFALGQAEFTKLTWTIPPGGTRHAFLVADLSTTLAADGDTLSAKLSGPLDVTFAEPTSIAALWPLDSGARVAVDGMVAGQVGLGSLPSVTLGPGDGPIAGYAFVAPANGYLPDVLQRVRVVNLGSATSSDLAEVRLWRDGGDGVFGPAGDDRDLGLLTWNGSAFESNALAETIAPPGVKLFVSVVLAASPADSTTVRFALPLGGLDMASGNDGPLDQPVAGVATLLISNAPLLASVEIVPGSSVIGRTVSARLSVRNRSTERVTGIAPTAPTFTGTGAMTIVAGPTPATLALDPGSSDTLTWTLRADAAGDVRLGAGATGTGQSSGQPRASLAATSPPHQVFAPASTLEATLNQAMPVSVTRGQAGVVPLSVGLFHPGSPDVAPIRIDRLAMRLEDADGTGLVPASLLSAVTVESGSAVLVTRDSLEAAGATVDLPLTSPLMLSAGSHATLVFRLDVSPGATAPNFRIVLVDSTALSASDPFAGGPIPVRLQGATYPYRTGVARIVSPATELRISAGAGAGIRATRGQAAVPLLSLTLENPGVDGVTSDARLFTLPVRLVDATLGAAFRLSDVLARVRVSTAFQTVAVRTIYPADDSTVVLALSPALAVPANAPVALEVQGDLTANAILRTVRMQIADGASVDARDAQTGQTLPVHLLPLPLEGRDVRIEAQAETLRARGRPLFPQRTRIGEAAVPAIAATLRHDGSPATGRIRVDALTVLFRDDRRNEVPPARMVRRLTVLGPGGEIGSVTGLPATGGSVTIPLTALVLEAGDSTAIELLADVDANAPEGFLELSIPGNGIAAADANLGTAVAITAEDDGELPLASGLTRLEPPARELRVDLTNRMPAMLAADGRPVAAGLLQLRNTAAQGSDTILVEQLVLEAASSDRTPLAIGAGAIVVEAWQGDSLWASSATLTADSTTAMLVALAPLAVPPASTVGIELRFRTVTGAPPPDLRLGVGATGVGVRQPQSALLHIDIRPESGGSFPLWTEAGRFQATDFLASVSNFPNPFAAGREATRFAYYLPVGARVSLRLTTAAGDPVRVLLDQAARGAGAQEQDAWDGRNGAGQLVRNGVYLAELVAHFDDGTQARAIRKVAVVR